MHIGIIPDGNRRYMKRRGMPDLEESYLMGIRKFYDVMRWCIDLNIGEVTIYALSTENLRNRTKEELNILLSLFSRQANEILNDERIHRDRVRIRVCGDKSLLNNNGLVDSMNALENATREYDNLRVNLAMGYGGRQEIVHAANELVTKGLEPTEENIQDNLWVKSDPDIIIRTSESRLSNFLTWQSAYSEIFFVDKLWQEFEKQDLVRVLSRYSRRKRRYGA